MNHRKMLQDSARATILDSVGKAILHDIQRLIASCPMIDLFQDTVETFRIDFAKQVLFPRIIDDRTRTGEASPKGVRRDGRIKAYKFTGIVIHTVVIACAWSASDGGKDHVQGKWEMTCL